MQKALSSLTQTEAFKLENWNYPWFFSVSHVKLLFFSFWLKQTRSFQLLVPEQGQCLENWKQMLGQILGVIYWEVNKTFQAAGKCSVSKYCQHVGKNSNITFMNACSWIFSREICRDIDISTWSTNVFKMLFEAMCCKINFAQ